MSWMLDVGWDFFLYQLRGWLVKQAELYVLIYKQE